MVEEKALNLEARLIAIEHVLAHVAKIAYFAGGIPIRLMEAGHKNFREGLRNAILKVPDAEPTLRNHFLSKIYEHADRLLSDIERCTRQGLGKT